MMMMRFVLRCDSLLSTILRGESVMNVTFYLCTFAKALRQQLYDPWPDVMHEK
jgi:hypothetical protein